MISHKISLFAPKGIGGLANSVGAVSKAYWKIHQIMVG
jgi:hypothetical protein